jgi:ABC-type sugar transport system substrate-binding protein
MKGPKMLATAVVAIALLASAAPASAKKPAAFKHYVACGLSQNAKPSHLCQQHRDKGAFFRSNLADVFYKVCVKFPTGASQCKAHQKAIKGTLYVNEITSNIPGRHRVSWFVGGKRVGVFFFTVPR